jgi:hypothetical protein
MNSKCFSCSDVNCCLLLATSWLRQEVLLIAIHTLRQTSANPDFTVVILFFPTTLKPDFELTCHGQGESQAKSNETKQFHHWELYSVFNKSEAGYFVFP